MDEVKRFKDLNSDEKKQYHREKSLARYYANPDKAAEQARKWRESNMEYKRTYQREYKRVRKLEAITYLGGKCVECNQEFHPAVYEFHHIDPTTKERDPSKMLSLSKKRLLAELDKCILLCANCHRLIHHEGNYGT